MVGPTEHPGKLLVALMMEQRITVPELATLLHLPVEDLTAFLKCEIDMTKYLSEALSRLFNTTTPDRWWRQQMRWNHTQIDDDDWAVINSLRPLEISDES